MLPDMVKLLLKDMLQGPYGWQGRKLTSYQ
jgi:hypothetical protein